MKALLSIFRHRKAAPAEPLRDGFAVSRLYRLRRTVRLHPFRFLLFFFPVILGWTIAMSYGAAFNGSNHFAVQYTPHIAFFTITIGIIIYPTRLFWIPTLVFLSMLVVPMVLPFAQNDAWFTLLAEAPQVVAVFFLANGVAGVLNGLLADFAYKKARFRMTPYRADLLLAFAAQGAFLILNLVMLGMLASYMATLSPDIQKLLGFDTNFIDLSLKRILRGCTVILVFLLAFLNQPARKDLSYIAPVVLIFLIVSILHANGFGGYASVDAAVVALILSLIIPGPIAPLALTVGVATYAAVTGNFLKDIVPATPQDRYLEYYSILLLLFLGGVLAYRGYVAHRESTSQLSILRLDAARDFADVGLFVVNQNKAIIQLDRTAMRVLGTRESFITVADAFDKIAPEGHSLLKTLGVIEPGQSENLVLRIIRRPGDERMARLFVWGERAESGAKLAYGLLLDITRQHNQQTALREALEDLEQKDEKQRRMFSIVSHEIRTPASVMAMLIDELSPETVQEILPKMREASGQLLEVLSDMRQAVNPDQNLAVRLVPYAPADLAETLRNTYQAQAERHRMRIVVTLGAGAAQHRMGDQARLKQLLGNLLRNSLIHSHGRFVEIGFEERLDDEGRMWSHWSVRDDGMGIPPDQVERLFQPFERGSKDPRTQADGSGLGLYIAKTAVELLGGTIEYIDTGRGACYTLAVPEEHTAALADPELTEQINADHLDLDVLLVEDNALVADVMKSLLEKRFASVSLARSGIEALDVVADVPPDVLITDLFMPEMEGDLLVRTLRERGFDFPMIGLTAATVGDDMERFHRAGADLVLSKPLDIKALITFLALPPQHRS